MSRKPSQNSNEQTRRNYRRYRRQYVTRVVFFDPEGLIVLDQDGKHKSPEAMKELRLLQGGLGDSHMLVLCLSEAVRQRVSVDMWKKIFSDEGITISHVTDTKDIPIDLQLVGPNKVDTNTYAGEKLKHNRCAEIIKFLEDYCTNTNFTYCILQCWGGTEKFGHIEGCLPNSELAKKLVQPKDMKLDAKQVVRWFLAN